MTTLCFYDYSEPRNVVVFNPTKLVDDAMCEFCARHGIPGRVTADAINRAQAHREEGFSTGAAIEHGKAHVREWLRNNSDSAA